MSVYMPLDCDGFAAALADYLEGDAPNAVRAAVEAHAEECADCRALLADLRAIPQQAAALPALTPSRDLWSGIAERIDTPVRPLVRPATRTVVATRRSWARPAIAAAALVVVTAGITHYITRSYISAPSVALSPAPASAARESATTIPQQVARSVTPPVPASPDNGSGSTMGQPGAQRSIARTPAVVAAAVRRPAAARLARADGLMS